MSSTVGRADRDTVGRADAAAAALTVDELAAATGLTVRTTRYYASLGLLPAAERRGRVAYYGAEHLARLELIRALQDHGFTLAAIERHLAGVPMGSSPRELSVQRALLTAWRPARWESVTRPELDERAGRPLTEDDVAWLVQAGVLRRRDGELQAHPQLPLAVQLRELGMPAEGLAEADAAVRRHMAELADELTEVLNTRVMPAYAHDELTQDEADRLEQTLHHLRTLTLDAIVNSFQAAARQLVRKSLSVEEVEPGRGG